MTQLTTFNAQPLTMAMTSREIAELTGKDIGHVHRDIRVMLNDLADHAPNLDHVREDKDARGYTACFHLPKDLTLTLVAGYSVPLRHRIVTRWMELEAAQAKQAAPALPNFANPAEAARAWALQYEETQRRPPTQTPPAATASTTSTRQPAEVPTNSLRPSSAWTAPIR